MKTAPLAWTFDKKGSGRQSGLFENLSHQPHMPERIQQSPLQHSSDRVATCRCVFMLLDRTVLDRASLQRFVVHRDRILHKQFDPYGREAG